MSTHLWKLKQNPECIFKHRFSIFSGGTIKFQWKSIFSKQSATQSLPKKHLVIYITHPLWYEVLHHCFSPRFLKNNISLFYQEGRNMCQPKKLHFNNLSVNPYLWLFHEMCKLSWVNTYKILLQKFPFLLNKKKNRI